MLDRYEIKALIDGYIAGNEEAFNELHKEVHKMINILAYKNLPKLNKASGNLLSEEDISQEIWLHILKYVHSYDPELGAFSTWTYKMAFTVCDRIYRHYTACGRIPLNDDKEVQGIASIHTTVGDEDTELLALLVDPKSTFETRIIEESVVYDYVKLMTILATQLENNQHRLIYMHQIMGLTLEESGCIIGLTRERVRQIRKKIFNKTSAIRFSYERGRINMRDSAGCTAIMLSDMDDDLIAEQYNYDLFTVKICRQVLSIAGLYSRR